MQPCGNMKELLGKCVQVEKNRACTNLRMEEKIGKNDQRASRGIWQSRYFGESSKSQSCFHQSRSERKEIGVYRSDDAGMSWNRWTIIELLVARSWYYMEVFADPQDESRLCAQCPRTKINWRRKTFNVLPRPRRQSPSMDQPLQQSNHDQFKWWRC